MRAATDAAGPEIYTFKEYVELLLRARGVRRRTIPVPNAAALSGIRIAEWLLRDRVLVPEELMGLQQELLLSHTAPRCQESVRHWLMKNGSALGRVYVNDTRRHFTDAATAPLSP